MNHSSIKAILVIITVTTFVSLSHAEDKAPAVAESSPSDEQKPSKPDLAEISVVRSGTDATGKHISIGGPESFSASKRGTEIEFEYKIINLLGESAFVETEPTEAVPMRYSDESGNHSESGGSTTRDPHGHSSRFALIRGASPSMNLVLCTSIVDRTAKITIPNNAKAGAELIFTITVRGFYLKNGQPFSGKVDLKYTLIE